MPVEHGPKFAKVRQAGTRLLAAALRPDRPAARDAFHLHHSPGSGKRPAQGMGCRADHHSTKRLNHLALSLSFNIMVESESPRLDAIFRALGDPTRRGMIRELARGDRTIGDLAKPFEMSLAAASKHVRALEAAGLVRREVHWRTHTCRLDPQALAAAHEWLDSYRRFWTDRLDLLEDLLRQEDATTPARPKGNAT
jgi:DNA-binding transcriptional ArsR family regulator